jgi:integrase
MTMPRRSRPPRQLDAGPLAADISSFRLHLAAEGKSARTVQGYTGAIRWFAAGIYQLIARHGRRCGVTAYPHRFRHHFSHTWLDRGGAERDLMELNGWTSPQMLARYGASARSARARRTYDRIMDDTT